jgi:hypothetical protein
MTRLLGLERACSRDSVPREAVIGLRGQVIAWGPRQPVDQAQDDRGRQLELAVSVQDHQHSPPRNVSSDQVRPYGWLGSVAGSASSRRLDYPCAECLRRLRDPDQLSLAHNVQRFGHPPRDANHVAYGHCRALCQDVCQNLVELDPSLFLQV